MYKIMTMSLVIIYFHRIESWNWIHVGRESQVVKFEACSDDMSFKKFMSS